MDASLHILGPGKPDHQGKGVERERADDEGNSRVRFNYI